MNHYPPLGVIKDDRVIIKKNLMKIPKSLPQFEKKPLLFLISGEFEAEFYVAKNGRIYKSGSFVLNPREEAKEKQAFVGKKGGMQSLSAVSHHGRYIQNLKEKFLKKMSETVDDISDREKITEISIFSPTYAENRILKKLSKKAREKVAYTHKGHFVKENPIRFIEMIQPESAK